MTRNSEQSAFLGAIARAGYAVRFRRNGWVEVLVCSASDQWLGRGIDRRGALADAERQMFPSAAARLALVDSLATGESRASSANRPPTAPSAPERVTPSDAPPTEPPQVTPPSALERPADLRAMPLLPYPRADRGRSSSFNAADVEVVHDELEEIENDIAFHIASITRWSPLRQRLKVTAWISRARGLQDRVYGDGGTHARVAGIAKNLSLLMKVGWPGAAPVLQIDSLPEHCAVQVEGRPKRTATSWIELAEECEAGIAFLNDTAEEAGEDEEGWFDAARLDPVAPDAELRLAVIQRRLVGWTGPVATIENVSDLRTVEGEPQLLGAGVLAGVAPRLVQMAKELRWLRGSELVGWGECMGRMRWLAYRHRNEHDQISVVRSLLDPEFVPRQSWAKECGLDPQRAQQKKEKNRLLKALSDTSAGPELETWLGQALSLGELLPNPKLLAEIQPRKADFLALPASPASFERSQRARWAWLRAQLLGADAEVSIEALEQAADEETDGVPAPLVGDASLERLLTKTRGKRALYVSNRNDPALDELLRRTFEFEELRRVVLSPSRVDSASESIRRGGVDVVLAATGFLPHKADSVLKSACVAANVKYVRVDRGRPQACQRHLMREFGVN